MIRLEKGDAPAVLVRNQAHWTAIVVGKTQSGEAPTRAEKTRYNHAEIKRTLIVETHGKCAYCESRFRHVSYGDIEHVVPKADDPSRWFDWANLTLACDVCNTNKAGAPGTGDAFIDPYAVDPEEHFWQLGPIMYPRPGCDAAALTERLLKLNRADLVERRKERQDHLMMMLDLVERCDDPQLKDLLWEEFNAESGAHHEYAALSRTIVEVARRRLGHLSSHASEPGRGGA